MEISPLYHNARPEGTLLPQEDAAFGILEELGIGYDRVSSAPADTMEKCAAVSQMLGVPICKNLFLCNRQKTQFYLLCMGPEKPFHTKDLSRQIGSARLSFAPEEKLWELLRCTPGSATILGLMNDTGNQVRLLMEREVYEAEYLSCHPCICTSSLKVKTSDILNTFLPYTGHIPQIVELGRGGDPGQCVRGTAGAKTAPALSCRRFCVLWCLPDPHGYRPFAAGKHIRAVYHSAGDVLLLSVRMQYFFYIRHLGYTGTDTGTPDGQGHVLCVYSLPVCAAPGSDRLRGAVRPIL